LRFSHVSAHEASRVALGRLAYSIVAATAMSCTMSGNRIRLSAFCERGPAAIRAFYERSFTFLAADSSACKSEVSYPNSRM
jgi:hypothetical protein